MHPSKRAIALSLAIHAFVVRSLFSLVVPRHTAPNAEPSASVGTEIELVTAHVLPRSSRQDQPSLETSGVNPPLSAPKRARSLTPLHKISSTASLPVSVHHPEPSADPITPSSLASGPVRGILRGIDTDAARAAGILSVTSPLQRLPSQRDLVPRERADPEARARAATQGYFERLLAKNDHTVFAGQYYWFLRRRMQETWHPGLMQPNAVGAVMSVVRNVVSDDETARQVAHESLGVLASERGFAAAESVSSAHALSTGVAAPGQASDAPMITNTLRAMSQAGARQVGTEVELDQDSHGRVLAIRVVRHSLIAGFDHAAVRAVRDAVSLQSMMSTPGGRRSRWLFEVIVGRDPIAVPIQGAPRRWNLAPMVGFDFDESHGWFDLRMPGAEHTRARISLLHSQPLGN